MTDTPPRVSALHLPASAVVNGTRYDVAEWEVNGPPVDYIRSLYATLPDPKWSAVDSHGHEHRWALTGRDEYHRDEALPTLVASTEHRPCDGSCGGTCGGEGYDVTVWHCATCGDPVEPGRIPDVQAQTTGVPVQVGPASGEFVVAADLSTVTGVVDVALTVGERTYAGRGSVIEGRWSSDAGPTSTVAFDFAQDPGFGAVEAVPTAAHLDEGGVTR